jgi:hypothetical protein
MKNPIIKTRFTEFFVRENDLSQRGFLGWVFYPGMLFQARTQWWGDRRERKTFHEGLDFCFYRDRESNLIPLNAGARIPVIGAGAVERIMDDFLGQTVVIEHSSSSCGKRILTLYGHTAPNGELCTGRRVGEGDVIGTIAAPRESERAAPAHLHISLFQAPRELSYESINWQSIHRLALEMLDPLPVLDSPYFLAPLEE